MLSSKTKRNIYRILPFGIIWLAFSIVYTLLERGILGHLDYYPATGTPYDFHKNILITPLAALLTGLLIGTIEIFYFNKLFIQKSFTKKILYKSFTYLAIIISFILIVSITENAAQLGTGVFSKQVWNNTLAFFTDYSFLSVSFFIAAVVLVSQFYSEVSENVGHGVLYNFFTGKYHSRLRKREFSCFLT